MPIVREKIGLGHNAGTLFEWNQISEGLFPRNRWPILSEWHECEGYEDSSGKGLPEPYGRAYFDWIFGYVSLTEGALLKSYEGEVTVFAFDKENLMDWATYNGTFVIVGGIAQYWKAPNHYEGVHVQVRYLDLIP